MSWDGREIASPSEKVDSGWCLAGGPLNYIGCQGWTRTNTERLNRPACYLTPPGNFKRARGEPHPGLAAIKLAECKLGSFAVTHRNALVLSFTWVLRRASIRALLMEAG